MPKAIHKKKQASANNKSSPEETTPVPVKVPENFKTVVADFAKDLATTFPEHRAYLERWITDEIPQPVLDELFLYFAKLFPERFFDILYQNDDIFKPESDANVEFFPGLDFKTLYFAEGVSETSRTAIWKYLQLILVSILGSIQDKSHFGNAMNMFDGVEESALHEKLGETIAGIGEFFRHMGGADESSADADSAQEDPDQSSTSSEQAPNAQAPNAQAPNAQMPNAADLHEHLKGLFDGKIGALAKELAEELSGDMADMFGMDGTENMSSTQDVLKKMMKNPQKIMGLMKTIGNKLNQKMKAGDISEQDIMKEASELMGKMKGMGGKGGEEFGEIFKNLAKGMGMPGAKMNMGALSQMSKKHAMKERMTQKLEERRAAVAAQVAEREASEFASRKAALANLKSYEKGEVVFRVDDVEQQPKSKARPIAAEPSEKDLDTLVAEINAVGTTVDDKKSSKGKKSKKAK